MKDFSDLPMEAKVELLAAIISRMIRAGVRTLDQLGALDRRTMEQVWEDACLMQGIERCTIPSRLMGMKTESTFLVHWGQRVRSAAEKPRALSRPSAAKL
ncbi:hypothetical protein SAMN05444161_8654 [Rhizobiales bacterium GAS191]|nr:hypothetical protein SAMN05444161_8654 [Rhizobiales bacterium GAS191]